MESSIIEYATVLFLVVVFVAAEVYRMRRAKTGRIVDFEDQGVALVALPMMKVQVRLDDGAIVQAHLNSCTACLGRLQIGDAVRVSPSRDGWVVDLPWVRGKKCSSSIEAQCRGTS